MNEAPTTWILVADRKQAKILVNYGKGTGLEHIPLGDMKARLIKSQQAMKAKQQKKGWFGFGGGTGVKKKVSNVLTGEITDEAAKVLNAAANRGVYDTLVLAGTMVIVSDVRGKLNDVACMLLHAELTRDLASAGDYELEKYIGNVIRL